MSLTSVQSAVHWSLSMLVACIFSAHGASSVHAQQQGESIPLYYDSATGNVTIDTTIVEQFGIYNWGIPFDGFNLDAYTPFMPVLFPDGWTESFVGEFNLNTMPGGTYSLGEILPAGLTNEELLTYFRDGPYSQHQHDARGIRTSVYHEFEPVYGPSPFPALNAHGPTVEPPIVDRWATAPLLTYSANTGSLVLDSTKEGGGNIYSYALDFVDPIVDETAFVPAAHEGLVLANSRQISEFGISPGGIPEGVYDLGNVLPAGLAKNELLDKVASLSFLSEPGHTSGSLDLEVSGKQFSLAYVVPEPHSGVLAIAGLFALTLLRAKRGPNRMGLLIYW